MKRALIITSAVACLCAASSVRAALNLVQDPGFEGGETGTLTLSSSPWFSSFGNTEVSITNSNPHTGSFNAQMASASTSDSSELLQNLTLTAGIGYTINFWAKTPGAGGTLAIDLNGVTAGTLVIPAGHVYTQYDLTATPVTSSGVLEFIWSSSSATPATLALDDVSVAVPEPTTMVAGALMLLPFAASTLRLRKKVSA